MPGVAFSIGPSIVTNPKPVIGILGGIGAGKSTVARKFGHLGCLVIDADRIGHQLLIDPRVREQVRQRWGQIAFNPDGSVNREALGKVVFDDPAQLAELNQIMWPRIRRRMAEMIDAVQKDAGHPAIVLDAAIMIEAGWDELCTHLVFVEAPGTERAGRVASSRGWDQRTWRDREKSQISLDSKLERCYFTIDNSSSIPCLDAQVRQILDQVISQTGLTPKTD